MKNIKRFTAFLVIFCLFAITFQSLDVKASEEESIKFDPFTIVKGDIYASFTSPLGNYYSINLNEYQYYRIINEEGKVRYYIADILTSAEDDVVYENNVEEEVAKENDISVFNVMVYNSASLTFSRFDTITLSVSFYLKEINDVVKIDKEISIPEYQIIIRENLPHQLGEDELSERLNASMNLMTNYMNINNDVEVINQSQYRALMSYTIFPNYYANSSNNILNYTYSLESDEFIENYESLYWGKYRNSEGKIINDKITTIIPKDLFYRAGKYAYIGKEYGFFLNTILESTNNYVCDVLVFDIDTYVPGLQTSLNIGSVIVTPLFQYRYYAKEKGNTPLDVWSQTYSSTLVQVVYPHVNYDTPNYYLTNVGFRFTVGNNELLSNEDAGYSRFDDRGEYIIRGEYSFLGEGKKTNREGWVMDNVTFRFGYVSNYGEDANNPEFSYGNFISTPNTNTPYYNIQPRGVDLDYVHYDLPYIDPYNNVYYYNYLTKTMRITPQRNDDNPLLIGTRTDDNFVRGDVWLPIMTRPYELNEFESLFHTSVYLEVVSDDTYYKMLNWFPQGKVNFLISAESTFYWGHFNMFHWSTTIFFPLHHAINTPGVANYYSYFSPSNSTFVIETFGNMDTVINVYDSVTSKLLATDDDSGMGFNAACTYKTDVHRYIYIVISFYSKYVTGEYDFEIRYDYEYPSSMPLGQPIDVVIENTWVNFFFIPTVSGLYRFETLGNTSDPYMLIADHHDFTIAENEDGPYGFDPLIELDLIAGEKYIVRICLKEMSYGTTTVIVNRI